MATPARRTYHAFAAMPFGTKEGIQFNRVYGDLIVPALEAVGFEVFRADEERRAGNIRTDMFQELLMADLVVADLSIDNPNVWYELGVRHALRARGVIQIQSQRDYMPFDVFVDRSLRYHLKDGVPDPEFLEQDKKLLGEFALATIRSWYGRRISPVYHLLRNLKEPDWKSLRVDEAREFWEAQEAWERRIQIARKQNRPGDILVLAEEAPFRALRLEAHKAAARALQALGQYQFALEQCEKALEVEPEDFECKSKKGLLLGRLKRRVAAQEWLRKLTEDHPSNAEACGLLARIDKEEWIEAWWRPGLTQEQMLEEARFHDATLREAIACYEKGFRLEPTNYYPGINAVTLHYLLEHLSGDSSGREARSVMERGIPWAVECTLAKNPRDYWARVTLADLALLSADLPTVERRYKDAVAVADRNWFNLDSSRQQLSMLRDLGFRPAEVQAALRIVTRALDGIQAPEASALKQVALFSGHMIDKPDRPQPRFPPSMEAAAAKAIAEKLDQLGVTKGDLAICGGACGGDILFAEAALARGMKLQMHLPFDEPAFLQASVVFAGDGWRDRFYALKANAATKILIMPDELGPLPAGTDPYSRNNLWMLYTARAFGDEKLRFVSLWDGKSGDGPGGTKDMVERVRKWSGQVHVLDANKIRESVGGN